MPMLLLLLLALLPAAPARASTVEACLVNRLPVPVSAIFTGYSSQEGSRTMGSRLHAAPGQRACARVPVLTPDGAPMGRIEMEVSTEWPGCTTSLRRDRTVTLVVQGTAQQPRCTLG